MARISGGITIARPVEEVFDVVADERNEPQYNPDLLSSEMLTAGPIGVGTRFRAVHAGRPRPFELAIELTEFDRPRRIGSTTASPAGTIRGAVTFEPAVGGTRMSWSWDVRPEGAARYLGPLVALIGRREERACWAGLKRYLEQEHTGAPG